MIRILYFIFVGLWLGGIVTVAAWVLIITIIGLPLGLWLLNRLPQLMTLKPVQTQTRVTVVDGKVVYRETSLPPHPFLLRALYFILVGWWFSAVWLILAWLLTGLSLGLGLPLAFWMFDRVPAITTLARY
ncbi:MAG: YccF domain-containing protein [Chloroflexi bacterium]|nr:MAG: YccF domain-containing protein [Chloroflexota bacterium]